MVFCQHLPGGRLFHDPARRGRSQPCHSPWRLALATTRLTAPIRTFYLGLSLTPEVPTGLPICLISFHYQSQRALLCYLLASGNFMGLPASSLCLAAPAAKSTKPFVICPSRGYGLVSEISHYSKAEPLSLPKALSCCSFCLELSFIVFVSFFKI